MRSTRSRYVEPPSGQLVHAGPGVYRPNAPHLGRADLQTIFDGKHSPPSVPPRGRGDAGELAAGIGPLLRQSTYTPRYAAYDLLELRGKGRVGRGGRPGSAGRLRPHGPPREPRPDVHLDNLQREMHRTFRALRLAV